MQAQARQLEKQAAIDAALAAEALLEVDLEVIRNAKHMDSLLMMK